MSNSGKSTAKGKSAEHDVAVLLARIDEQNEQMTRLQSKFRGNLTNKST
jgi:hypothetical protein